MRIGVRTTGRRAAAGALAGVAVAALAAGGALAGHDPYGSSTFKGTSKNRDAVEVYTFGTAPVEAPQGTPQRGGVSALVRCVSAVNPKVTLIIGAGSKLGYPTEKSPLKPRGTGTFAYDGTWTVFPWRIFHPTTGSAEQRAYDRAARRAPRWGLMKVTFSDQRTATGSVVLPACARDAKATRGRSKAQIRRMASRSAFRFKLTWRGHD